jgi:hypothetical protein
MRCAYCALRLHRLGQRRHAGDCQHGLGRERHRDGGREIVVRAKNELPGRGAERNGDLAQREIVGIRRRDNPITEARADILRQFARDLFLLH